MKIEAFPIGQLDAEQLQRWRDLQAADPLTSNPFCSPEFLTAVAAVRQGVEVAIFRDAGEIVGFLPFQRGRWNVGRPVADVISDFQGIVGAADAELDGTQFLRECRLSNWRFDCVPVSQKALVPFHFRHSELPYVDLRHGFDQYAKQRRAAGSSAIVQAMRKARKIEREVGELRFVMHTTDRDAFQSLLVWKSAQYKRLGVLNRVRIPWIARLLERLTESQSEHFSGVFSVLYLGSEPIAVHLGMLANGVLAMCFPTYGPKYQSYSPGQVLFAKMIEACPGFGITRIDLGPGPERYKASLASGSFMVAEGSIEKSNLGRAYRETWTRTREWVGSSPLGNTPLRLFRRIRNSVRAT